jgi:N-acetylneuraminic acid mutarotase
MDARRLKVIFLSALFLVSPVGSQTWKQINPSTAASPQPRRNATAVYDQIGNRMIIFGGQSSTGNLNDVWAFDFTTSEWLELSPAETAPSPRFGHNAVYDLRSRRMIIWSGQGVGFFNDVWAFDLVSNTWQELGTMSPKPNARYGSAAVYDEVNHRVVMYAGFTNLGRFDDTQAFNLSGNSWVDLTPPGEKPQRRCLHTASYDAPRNRMIMYGGQSIGALDDLWAFDFQSNSWTNLTQSLRPPGRFLSASVCIDNKFYVFGGTTGVENSNETWMFDLTLLKWAKIDAGALLPEQRNGHTAILIPQENSIAVFGGSGANLLNDVWKLENAVTSVVEYPLAPLKFSLEQNYPNPFNPSTSIQYRLRESGFSSLAIYDLRGYEVHTLLYEFQAPGDYTVHFQADQLASGVYFYRLTSGGLSQTRKMLLLK